MPAAFRVAAVTVVEVKVVEVKVVEQLTVAAVMASITDVTSARHVTAAIDRADGATGEKMNRPSV